MVVLVVWVFCITLFDNYKNVIRLNECLRLKPLNSSKYVSWNDLQGRGMFSFR